MTPDGVILDELVDAARRFPDRQLLQFRSRIGANQYRRLYRLVRRFTAEGAAVLDWGSGNGHFTYFLQRAGRAAHGFSLLPGAFREWIPEPDYPFTQGDEAEPVPVRVRLAAADRADLGVLAALRLGTGAGTPLSELTTAVRDSAPLEIHHKNLRRVVYVLGDVAGRSESPVYAIFTMNEAIARLALPEGYSLEVFNATQPFDTSKYAMKWDGEWHITIEVFRDLGIAFAAVLLLIYVLVVGWFRSFKTPLLIMAAIPFSLVGILPAHAAMGAFFTATSMIGFIAGAGIVVRNSIILVDFIELRLRDGLPLEQAVVDAGAVRFRPMALTAAAVIVGAGVILFDPIFQGLAISLMAGEVASLLLSRMAVPVLYYMAGRHTRAGMLVVTSPAEAAV